MYYFTIGRPFRAANSKKEAEHRNRRSAREKFRAADQIAPAIRNTAATVRMAYNSGKAARISVLPITSWPLPIAAIPLAHTFDWKYDEARQTRPVSRPAAEDGSSLQQGHRIRKEPFDDEVAHETVKALRTGDSRQDHVATESPSVFFMAPTDAIPAIEVPIQLATPERPTISATPR